MPYVVLGVPTPEPAAVSGNTSLLPQFLVHLFEWKFYPTYHLLQMVISALLQLEPTYRMEPKVKLSSERVERLLYAILTSRLKPPETQRTSVTFKYKDNMDELTLSITDEIRASIREMSYERYRLVVVVSLFELVAGVADVMFASRCLWDPQFDTFAEATVSTQNMYAVAVVYAVYYE